MPSLSALALGASLIAAPIADSSSVYRFEVAREWLTMPDGVRLSVTFWRPLPKQAGERFPVLLELLPYRKDDSFYRRDWPLYTWFARHGYLMAKVDIRGTGSSEGTLPEREYSDQELDDAVEIIAQLAQLPGSSGAVGMWGISWGGFNALQVAMRRPPALKAVLALHASDDLYHDDVRYIDGVLHLDPYALQIDHENALPAPPDYRLDAAYFRNRFEREPWMFVYLRHPVDGEFWQRNSVRSNYGAINVPVYLIGGLLDGYRDPVLRLLDSLRVPVKAEIGPWQHDWPDNGLPGPNYEWRRRALAWWDHWLKGRPTTLLEEPRLLLFVRAGDPPDPSLEQASGSWRFEDWPIRRTEWRRLYPGEGRTLGSSPGGGRVDSLRYLAGAGSAAGDWWGDPTGDMRPDDATSLVYDTPPLESPVEIVGFPRVMLGVTASAPLAHWAVRLEDVSPTGEVALVTGAAINGAQRESSLRPRPLAPGSPTALAFDLHFTTWTFQPGHRIRLAVSNAQFPMLWPTPHPMVTTLTLDSTTALSLPVMPGPGRHAPPRLPPPEPRESRPDARALELGASSSTERETWDPGSRTTTVEWTRRSGYVIGAREVRERELERYRVSDQRPAEASFEGEADHEFRLGKRRIELRTRVALRSDERAFRLEFVRTLLENGRVVRTRRWEEAFPREHH